MACLAAALSLAVPVLGSPQGDVHSILDVPATEAWTDTGVDVGPGDRIEIRAWGTARFDGGRDGTPVGPAGAGKGGGCTFVATNAAIPAQALIANVAPTLTFDGAGFFVGTQWRGRIPVPGTTAQSGRLWLGFNDRAVACDRSGYDSWGFRNDNAGAFTVELSITRRR